MSENNERTSNFQNHQQMNARVDLAAAHRQAVNDGFMKGSTTTSRSRYQVTQIVFI